MTQFARRFTKAVCISVSLLIVVACTGCAARSANMVPAQFDLMSTLDKTVAVTSAAGGVETSIWGTSQISNTEFNKALDTSLRNSGLFKAVLPQEDTSADYMLNVTIINYDKPMFGIDFDISMKTTWYLIDPQTHEPVWLDTFTTSYTAKFGEALVGAERLQKANEGSVRENIKEGFKRISQQKL